MNASLLHELGLRPVWGWARDAHFHLALAAGLLTGVVLWAVMPSGYARPVWSAPWLLMSFLLLQPALEELLFRGVIQGQTLSFHWGRRRWLGISMANIVTSILFVLLHLMHHTPIWALAVFVPSLVFGHLRERHASLWPALLMHSGYNAIYLTAGL
ncbi:MAG: JDVT-CTERM system glutamic-type intramembrane protease [Pseudomonadota bacterium]